VRRGVVVVLGRVAAGLRLSRVAAAGRIAVVAGHRRGMLLGPRAPGPVGGSGRLARGEGEW
jgi:hypothetical protein